MTSVGYLILVIPTSSRDLKKVQNQRTACFGYLKKNSEAKNCQFWVFQKLQKTSGLHERTGKDLAL